MLNPSSSDGPESAKNILRIASLAGVVLLGGCASPPKVVKYDVVCGAIVSKRRAIQYTYEGAIYYFDMPECLETFKADPQRYASR